jgi:hypothetical protein
LEKSSLTLRRVPAFDGERATVLGGIQGKLAPLVALRATLDSALRAVTERQL